MVLLVAEQIWIIVRAIFLNYCHSTRAIGSLPSSACCGWGEGGGALVSPTFCLLFPVDELQENRKVNARPAEEEEEEEGGADYQRKTTLFCAFPRGLSCALTSRMKCATCETGIAANTAADDREAGRPGRGEDCFSWCPRRSNPRVSFSLPASCCCCCRRRHRDAQFPRLIARVSQEVLATGCLVIPCSASRHACGRLCGVVIKKKCVSMSPIRASLSGMRRSSSLRPSVRPCRRRRARFRPPLPRSCGLKFKIYLY